MLRTRLARRAHSVGVSIIRKKLARLLSKACYIIRRYEVARYALLDHLRHATYTTRHYWSAYCHRLETNHTKGVEADGGCNEDIRGGVRGLELLPGEPPREYKTLGYAELSCKGNHFFGIRIPLPHNEQYRFGNFLRDLSHSEDGLTSALRLTKRTSKEDNLLPLEVMRLSESLYGHGINAPRAYVDTVVYNVDRPDTILCERLLERITYGKNPLHVAERVFDDDIAERIVTSLEAPYLLPRRDPIGTLHGTRNNGRTHTLD